MGVAAAKLRYTLLTTKMATDNDRQKLATIRMLGSEHNAP